MMGTLVRSGEVMPGSLADWWLLSRYHYCGENGLGPVARVFVFRLPSQRGPMRLIPDGVAGIVVYGYCIPNSAARARALPGRYPTVVRGADLVRLNREMRCLRRIVIHPLLRGLGLGARLVRETLGRVGVDRIECLARMGHYHPFLVQAGMQAWPAPDGNLNKPVYYLWCLRQKSIFTSEPFDHAPKSMPHQTCDAGVICGGENRM